MKSKDQTLLEEAYKKVSGNPFRLKDSKGAVLNPGDTVRHEDYEDCLFKVVGGDINKEKTQLEKIQDLPPGQSPHFIWTKGSKITKTK
jgi:hypothetical protein